MSDDHTQTWRELGTQAKDTVVVALSGIVRLVQDNFLLLTIVGLTGAISYQSLYEMALALNPDPGAKWVAKLFPLQLDAAAIPAYQVAADAGRRWYHRMLGALVCVVALGGSVYGNLVAHLKWTGDAPKVFVSIVPPIMCAAALLLFHLPRIAEKVERVVAGSSSASRYVESEKPTESSPSETEVTPEPVKVKLHPVGPLVPPGPWTDASAPSIRAFVAAWWDLNGHEPTTEQVCANMPPQVRAQRSASAQIAAVRAKREAVG